MTAQLANRRRVECAPAVQQARKSNEQEAAKGTADDADTGGGGDVTPTRLRTLLDGPSGSPESVMAAMASVDGDSAPMDEAGKDDEDDDDDDGEVDVVVTADDAEDEGHEHEREEVDLR